MSMRGSLFAPLSRFLASVLAPYCKGGSYVENSLQARQRLSSALESHPGGALGSFDVVSLFTRVPVQEAMEVVGRFLSRDEDLSSRTALDVETLGALIKFCLTSCYFLFRSTFYVQLDGVAMGSSLGCVVACIYMRFFEEMALNSAVDQSLPVPLLWIRYVDDVLAMFHDEEDFGLFLSFLNSLRGSIDFTLEVESEGHISFLDLDVRRRSGGVVYGVYRKPTHTDLYLRRDSCHPPYVFRGLVSCLKKRAFSVCSSSELPAELRHVRHALSANGYSQRDLSLLNSRNVRRVAPSEAEEAKRVVLPYVPGLSQRISRCFRRTGLRVSMRPPPTLRSLLCRKKPGQLEKHGLVYRIPCSACPWSYIGETGRTLRERVAEHKRAVRDWVTSSEIANHVAETGHAMNWEASAILSLESHHFRRVFKEAWFTRVQGSGNRVFHELDGAWGPLLPPSS